ncbi:uncharacterized protein [Solanum lycopersicum]|uniref:uncharacterized protein n=1 Tax=Solanum lycopersicum TaxID=4081 RepID=UPI0037490EE6
MNVNEYGLKFTQLSRYAPEMVKNMRSRMSLFVVRLGRASSKEGRASMLIGDNYISRIMVYVQQVEEEKLRDRDSPVPRDRVEHHGQNSRSRPTYSQGSVAQGVVSLLSAPSVVGITLAFVAKAPQVPVFINCSTRHGAPRGTTSGTSGGTNSLYALNNRQEQVNSSDVVTGKIRVFDFTVYALLDPGGDFIFCTPYVVVNFETSPEQHSEPFSVSTPVGEPILAERVYRDCPISINHKNIMADLIELDMGFVERFSVISSPLTKLTQKTVKFQWSEACDKKFQDLKKRLTTASILT